MKTQIGTTQEALQFPLLTQKREALQLKSRSMDFSHVSVFLSSSGSYNMVKTQFLFQFNSVILKSADSQQM